MERIKHLNDLIEFPSEGILSKTIHESTSGEADLFMLPKGGKISGHTSSRDAAVMILKGEGEFMLGEEWHSVNAGDWFFMEAGLVHALTAKSDMAFLLTLFGA
ncbi:MAG: cupin domain-containing protein [Armatimonadota bacterium]